MINMFTETQDRLTSHTHTHHPLPVPPWTHNIMSHQLPVCVLYATELMTACVQMASTALVLTVGVITHRSF